MFEIWFVVVFLIGGFYAFILLWLIIGVKRLEVFQYSKHNPITSFSIIIAFRNEEANLNALLQSLAQIDYPKQLFEILLVNDASTDQSAAIVNKYIIKNEHLNISLLENKRKSISPKKDAINTAIEVSKFDWIITTDADCTVSKKWLTTYNAFINKNNAVFIAGLVLYSKRKGFLHQFQQLDWLSLIGVTMGSFGWNKPLLCSGANLAYQKEVFYKVNGFAGNEHIASGDDVFLMQKVKEAFPNQVSYLNSPNALVQTQSVDTWKDLYQQRIRWAKKTSSLSNNLIKIVGISVLLSNLSFIVLFFIGFYDSSKWLLLITFLVLKIAIDSVLLYQASKKGQQKINLGVWLFSSLLYPFFSVSVVLLGVFSKYRWKGREFRK